ncbi:MAG TPA: sigma-70 family RNA polymerase sigma factor [Candidatus Kapabacteria bacterium]
MALRDEYTKLTDEELAARFRGGERSLSFTMLVERYQKRIYLSARRMAGGNHDEADDIAQETFVKMYEALDGFRGEAKLYTWLYRIMMNAVIHRSRKKKTRNAVNLDDVGDTLVSSELSPDGRMEKTEMTRLIEEAIEQLPPKQREVFLLRFYDELPYEEIAQAVGTSVGGLKANYFHAVKKIGEYVQAQGKIDLSALVSAG